MANDFRLIDATRHVMDDLSGLLSRSHPRLLHEVQLTEAVGSIAANIREAYGRKDGAERKQFLRYARASAEESTEHLRANFGAKRIRPTTTGGIVIG